MIVFYSLTVVSLSFKLDIYTEEDLASLLQTFTNAGEFNDVEVLLSYGLTEVMLKTVLFQIIDNCSDLRKLRIDRWGPYFGTNESWAGSMTRAEFSRFHLKVSNMKYVKIFDIEIKNSSSLELSTTNNSVQLKNLRCLLQDSVPYLRHITLGITDDSVLQRIFQHLVSSESYAELCSHAGGKYYSHK